MKLLLAALLSLPAFAGQIVTDANIGFIKYNYYTLIANRVAVCAESDSVAARGPIFLRCGDNNRSWRFLADAVPKNTRFYGYSVEASREQTSVVVYYRLGK